MLPYSSLQEAETAIGRPLTIAETLWFKYSANKSDYVLYCHNIPLIFFLTTFLPLVYVVIEFLFPDYAASYKIQPKIRVSLYENFKMYLGVMRTFILLVVPILLASHPSIQVR